MLDYFPGKHKGSLVKALGFTGHLHRDVAGPSNHHRVRSVLEELFLCGPVLVLFFLLLFVDFIKVLHHRSPAVTPGETRCRQTEKPSLKCRPKTKRRGRVQKYEVVHISPQRAPKQNINIRRWNSTTPEEGRRHFLFFYSFFFSCYL